MPPVVHILEASTGRMLHTIAGLSWPRLADLDGDGLEDLWGSVEGKLRAFRAGPPEAWRSPRPVGPGRRPRRRWRRSMPCFGAFADDEWEKVKGRQPHRRGPVGPRRPRAVARRPLEPSSDLPRVHDPSRSAGGDLDGDGAPEVARQETWSPEAGKAGGRDPADRGPLGAIRPPTLVGGSVAGGVRTRPPRASPSGPSDRCPCV